MSNVQDATKSSMTVNVQSSRFGNRELVICNVCMDEYNEDDRLPKFLVCHHSFCMACLNRVLKGSRIECPTCRCSTGNSVLAGQIFVSIARWNHKIVVCENLLYLYKCRILFKHLHAMHRSGN